MAGVMWVKTWLELCGLKHGWSGVGSCITHPHGSQPSYYSGYIHMIRCWRNYRWSCESIASSSRSSSRSSSSSSSSNNNNSCLWIIHKQTALSLEREKSSSRSEWTWSLLTPVLHHNHYTILHHNHITS